ncbi:MAG: RNA-binding protein [Acidobacteriota bacterium]
MSKRIYVGNLPFSATDDEVREVFEAYGEVTSVSLIGDRETGRPRGFGFVEMADGAQADEAIEALDGTNMGGRNLKISEARPRPTGGGGGGGGYRGGGGYGGGGGGGW